MLYRKSLIYVSDVAFANQDDEHAHFDAMRGRLDALLNIHRHFGFALEDLHVTYSIIGVEVQELSEYISSLSPPPSGRQYKRVGTGTTNKPRSSRVKSLLMKARVSTLASILCSPSSSVQLFGNALRR